MANEACTHDDRDAFDGVADPIIERAASLLRAMADAERLRVLEQLATNELCVSEIAARSANSMSAVSQRLKLLRNEGLVTRRRDGKHIYYRLADDHVASLVSAVLEHAAEPHPS